ncbi:MAG: hypothetical protein ACI8XG_001633 [Congregibacter sp.]|jgi:hypothetical protein
MSIFNDVFDEDRWGKFVEKKLTLFDFLSVERLVFSE